MEKPKRRRRVSRDPLERMRVYQLAKEIVPDCFDDASQLAQNPVTVKVAGQLYAAVGSVAVNISEGYSRSSGKDRARIFEYALGSARESIDWYESAEPVLSYETVDERLKILDEIAKMLLAIIPRERKRKIEPFDK
jgi:four helix bundle protein